MESLLASESVVEAGKRPITRSINDLLLEYDLERDSLRGVKRVLQALEKYGIALDPSFEDWGDLNDRRTLKARREEDDLIREVREVVDGIRAEGYGVELKASIRIDTNKRKFNPGLSIEQYISKELEVKLAQEICAFMNRDGGIIYLGIRNDHSVCGCQDDFDALKTDGSNKDKADLVIRQIVEKSFVNANRILSYLLIEYVEFSGFPMVILRIAKSECLVFLKKACGSSSQLYLRVGTSAIPIDYEKIEDYFTVRLTNA